MNKRKSVVPRPQGGIRLADDLWRAGVFEEFGRAMRHADLGAADAAEIGFALAYEQGQNLQECLNCGTRLAAAWLDLDLPRPRGMVDRAAEPDYPTRLDRALSAWYFLNADAAVVQ